MDEFNDMLLEGEEVLWSGRPDGSLENINAAKVDRRLRLFSICLIVIVTSYIAFGKEIAVVVFLASLASVTGGSMKIEQRDRARFAEDVYVATNRRVIVKRHSGEVLIRDWQALQAYDIRKIGSVKDVVLSFDSSATDHVKFTLYAITDVDALIKLIHKLT